MFSVQIKLRATRRTGIVDVGLVRLHPGHEERNPYCGGSERATTK